MTLNNIISRLEAFARSHKQIKYFDSGDMVNILVKGGIEYPAFFLELMPLAGATVGLGDRMTTYNFRVWICDLADTAAESLQNEIEVKSDLASICEDYIAMLNMEAKTNSDFNLPMSNYPVEFWNEKFEDVVIAASMQIGVGTKYAASRCQVPATGIQYENLKDDDMINTYRYQSVAPVQTITLPLKMKKILLFIAGAATLDQLPIGSVLAVSDYTYDPLTGIFIFGMEMQPAQILQILYRNI